MFIKCVGLLSLESRISPVHHLQCTQSKLSALVCFASPQFTLDSHRRHGGVRVLFYENPICSWEKEKPPENRPHGIALWSAVEPSSGCSNLISSRIATCVCVFVCTHMCAVVLQRFLSCCAGCFSVLQYLCPGGRTIRPLFLTDFFPFPVSCCAASICPDSLAPYSLYSYRPKHVKGAETAWKERGKHQ